MGMTTNLTTKGKRDYELVIRAVKRGDQRAYANLMELYREPIYYMILQMIKNNADADDLTIEAFGKAFKRLDQYTPDYAFSTWLFTIATNNCIDFIRRKKMDMISLDRSEQIQSIFSRTPDPEETIIEKQKIKLMQEVITKLKPIYQQLIDLHYFQDKTYDEIEQITGIAANTIKVKLFRAREFLYNIIITQHNDLIS
jgi:RNA polymerase sigma-70 factor (ECF subfamily)